MGCYLGSCCPNAKSKNLSNFLLVFIFIKFVVSLTSAIIRPSSTDRYKEALKLLYETNNKIIYSKFPLSCFRIFYKEEKYHSIIYNYNNGSCIVNNKEYEEQKEKIEYKSIFKNLKKIELSLNILRIMIIGFYFIDLFLLKLDI